jgi:hypothetical protein
MRQALFLACRQKRTIRIEDLDKILLLKPIMELTKSSAKFAPKVQRNPITEKSERLSKFESEICKTKANEDQKLP